MIVEDSDHRFVTDSQITDWDNKAELSDIDNKISKSYKVGFSSALYKATTRVSVRTGQFYFVVPDIWNGLKLREGIAALNIAGSGFGSTTIQIRRRRNGTDEYMLNNPFTLNVGDLMVRLDQNDISSSNDEINGGDMIFIDILSVTRTKPKGLTVTIVFYEV
jgi:hypothetical protein